MEITHQELTELRYAAMANKRKVGLYGDSVFKWGRVAPCEDLIKKGLLEWQDRGPKRAAGYWLTDLGREYLQTLNTHAQRSRAP